MRTWTLFYTSSAKTRRFPSAENAGERSLLKILSGGLTEVEFLVLASRHVKSERERVVMQAVMEAAETLGAERVVTRRGNVYSIGVYIREGDRKNLVYIDWEKDWEWKRICSHIVSSMPVSVFNRNGFEGSLATCGGEVDA